ncbi:MAG: cysteine desulfurase [Bacteroidetes bacterium]|nr:cysteine desulfurase [Bacteroidota bacterium]MBK8657438.1 cysteine desulfurase [Bacteroidota bacterium]
MGKIYLDNAATTRISDEVLQEMMPFLTENFGNPSSIHSFGRVAKSTIEKARRTVAKYLNVSTSEIFFTGSGTESNNTAIKCAVRDLGVTRIISSAIEHHCVLHSVEAEARAGVQVEWVQLDHEGRVNLAHLEQLLAQPAGKTLVSLMHANNEIGTINDLNALSQLCQKYGALLHSDTVQTIGYVPFNLQETKVQFLSGSAHKFHGPKGVGFLYIQGDVHIHPFIDGGSQERNMRAGTENVAGIAGLGKALEQSVAEMEANRALVSGLKNYMIQQLTEHLPAVQFNGDISEQGGNYKVLNVSLPPHPKAELVLFNLDMAGIAASGGSACTSGSEKASHVLEGIHAAPNRKAVRFSFSKYNTRADIDAAVQVLSKMYAGQAVEG